MHLTSILIIDFGSQYTQLIARRVREIGVYCEIYPYDTDPESIQAFAPKGIILSGGPASVIDECSPQAPPIIFDLGCPILGICYGMQAMAAQLGGQVKNSKSSEFGFAKLDCENHSLLFPEDIQHFDVWMSHGDQISTLPAGFKVIGKTATTPFAAIADEQRHFYALQFHPEVTHTSYGQEILKRFVFAICHCQAEWQPNTIIQERIEKIRRAIGSEQVILGLSGGVDSSVAALLLHEAIGEQLICVFVDTGLLRLNEAEEIKAYFSKARGMTVRYIDAADQFFAALKGVVDPEEKRKMIGKTFIDVFEAEAMKCRDVKWLAQGTIYSDVIESAATHLNKSEVIKSHHNVGGLPQNMRLRLIEPLRELFKDEVKVLGELLELPANLLHRHPFPGPGLAVRILGEVDPEQVDLLQRVDAIFISELKQQKLYDKVSQAFAVLLPVKSVAVKGDGRVYERVTVLRAVETVDFMTANLAPLPFDFLTKVSSRIINEVKGISRVTYDISSKPPATIEWE